MVVLLESKTAKGHNGPVNNSPYVDHLDAWRGRTSHRMRKRPYREIPCTWGVANDAEVTGDYSAFHSLHPLTV
jgi:hypothetical protein